MKTLNFFVTSLKMTLSQQMAYKADFLIRTVTLLAFDLTLPFMILMIYFNTNGFSGWNLSQILLFQGVFFLLNSLDRMFFQRVDWSLSYSVRNGAFDRYLLYPVNTLVYISFTNIGIEHTADFLIGISLIIYSAMQLGLHFSLAKIALFSAFVILGIVFTLSLALLKYSLIIRAVRIGRIGELFRTVKTYGQFPADIYGTFVSSLVRYMIPLALLAYYPSKALIGGATENFAVIALITIAIFALSLALWNRTLKFYTSAGG